MIYLDNAATSYPKPPAVIEAVTEAMGQSGNPSRGAHQMARWAARAMDRTRDGLARLFHIPDSLRISFTSNVTHSLNIAVNGALSLGDHVITTVLEHNSVLRPLHLYGVETTLIGYDEKEGLHYGELTSALRANTKAVICTHASNVTGDVVDLVSMSRFCREHGLLLIVDAAQTAGVFPIDVEALGIDILCFTGHKSLMGPQGTGGIYVRQGLSLRPFMVGGSGSDTFQLAHPSALPDAFEAGTQNCPAIAGLGAGLEWIQAQGMEAIRTREQQLTAAFERELARIPAVHIYRHAPPEERAPIVTLTLGDADPAVISGILAEEYSIATRAGAHCAPNIHRTLGTEQSGAVRFSFSYHNTEEEVQAAVSAIQALAKQLQ